MYRRSRNLRLNQLGHSDGRGDPSSMSFWDEHDLTSLVIAILNDADSDPEHPYGSRFLTAYQLAIEIDRRVRGHEKVPGGGQVEVPAGGQVRSPLVAK